MLKLNSFSDKCRWTLNSSFPIFPETVSMSRFGEVGQTLPQCSQLDEYKDKQCINESSTKLSIETLVPSGTASASSMAQE